MNQFKIEVTLPVSDGTNTTDDKELADIIARAVNVAVRRYEGAEVKVVPVDTDWMGL